MHTREIAEMANQQTRSREAPVEVLKDQPTELLWSGLVFPYLEFDSDLETLTRWLDLYYVGIEDRLVVHTRPSGLVLDGKPLGSEALPWHHKSATQAWVDILHNGLEMMPGDELGR